MDHMGLREPLFTDMDFTRSDPRFIMVSSELGLTIRRRPLFIEAAIDTPWAGGRGYAHVRHYGYAYSHRYAYGRHGYAYRRYGGGYYAGGYTGGSYYYSHHHHYPYYASGYSYRHHHGCWWYRHYDPYDMPSWCYGPAYSYSAPVYEYSYEPSYGYAYGVYGGTWRGGHHGHAWGGGWHGGHGGPTAPPIGASHINGSPRGFAIAHGEAHFGGHMYGRFMH